MNKSANTSSVQTQQPQQASPNSQRNTYKLGIYLAEIFAVLAFLMLVSLIANQLIFSKIT